MPGKKVKLPLSVTHPELAKEAEGWDPDAVSPGSGKKLRWKCKADHSWEAQVCSRALLGTGCPYCSGSRVIVGTTDLKSTHPEIASQANGWDPTTVSASSNKKLPWKCKLDHIWETAVASRTRGSGCPFCKGQRVLPGFNDLKTKNPALAEQAFKWNPSEVMPQSNKSLAWKCGIGHVWNASVSDRVRGNGCPTCGNQKLEKGFNDLATKSPELAREADGWDPSSVFPGTTVKKNWKCKFGHKWSASVSSRNRGNGCPVCAGKKVLSGFNDLATLNPELADQADGWDTTKYTISSGSSMPWVCSLGHKWQTSIAHRSNGTNCPICAGQKVLVGFNDLATLNPELAEEAVGWNPASVQPHSDKIVDWICKQGHVFSAAVKDRSKGRGCAVCSGKQINIGANDLSSTHPEIAAEAYGWNPQTVTAGSTSKKLKWICNNKHVYEATPAARTRSDGKNTSCPICANKQVLKGFNDLLTTNPNLASEAFGWDPSIVTAGSHLIKRWRCQSGHEWNARVNSRRISGCPSCAVSGFNPNLPAYIYFLDQTTWEMYQIGITNDLQRRLNEHSRNGWEVIDLRGPMDGHLAQQWETAILRMLKSSGADLSNQQIAGKFDGYSEAWSKSSFEVKSIIEMMNRTEEIEQARPITKTKPTRRKNI